MLSHHWPASADGPFFSDIWILSPLITKKTKKTCQSWPPSDKNLWIRACKHIIVSIIIKCLNRLHGYMYIIEQSYTTLTKITSVVVAGDGSDKVHARLSEPLISRHYWNRKALRPSKTKIVPRDMYHGIMLLYNVSSISNTLTLCNKLKCINFRLGSMRICVSQFFQDTFYTWNTHLGT